MPRARMLVVASVALAVVGAASPASAAPDPADDEGPSLAWPVLGVAVAAGGAALVYHHAKRARTGEPGCLRFDGGCLWLGLAGTLVEEAGGAMVAYWGWRLGQRAFARDGTRDVSTMRTLGLVAGGAALIAIYVGATYAAIAPFGCIDRARGELDYKCIGPKQYTAQLIALGATPVLLVAAPVAAYGLGYESARRDAARKPRALEWSVAPALFAGGSGLRVFGQF